MGEVSFGQWEVKICNGTGSGRSSLSRDYGLSCMFEFKRVPRAHPNTRAPAIIQQGYDCDRDVPAAAFGQATSRSTNLIGFQCLVRNVWGMLTEELVTCGRSGKQGFCRRVAGTVLVWPVPVISGAFTAWPKPPEVISTDVRVNRR